MMAFGIQPIFAAGLLVAVVIGFTTAAADAADAADPTLPRMLEKGELTFETKLEGLSEFPEYIKPKHGEWMIVDGILVAQEVKGEDHNSSMRVYGEIAEMLFDLADLNVDGHLTMDEFLAAYEGRRSQEESRPAFARQDKNDDGTIARREFVGGK